MADPLTERSSAFASGPADTTRGQMERAGHAAEGVANEMQDQARQGMDTVRSNLSGALDKSLKEQPMATLAIAAAAGFVLGALWKT